ncbi:MAG TPA: tetratricopeptide repeat protein [Xanthobacteraceae bacterium]|nr:tetratricopeptide repeat protein [Xanthobacteraceae bacterium]
MKCYDAGVYLAANLEGVMRTPSLLAAAILLSAAASAPNIAKAMEGNNPAPPQTQPPSGTKGTDTKGGTDSTKGTKTKSDKSGAVEDFYKGWHKAYALIYDKADYAGGIAVLRAMGYDDNADVATLIGYASRKLGRYDDAKLWYDRALAADPNHALTWSYYGMWHAEQGNILKAKDDLEKVKSICGNTTCREYTALKAAIDGTVTY